MYMDKDATMLQDAAAGERVLHGSCSQDVKDSRIRLQGSPRQGHRVKVKMALAIMTFHPLFRERKTSDGPIFIF